MSRLNRTRKGFGLVKQIIVFMVELKAQSMVSNHEVYPQNDRKPCNKGMKIGYREIAAPAKPARSN